MFWPRGLCTQSLSSGQIKVYFNQGIDLGVANGLQPDGDSFADVLSETIARIDAAQQTLDVAMYNNNRYDLTAALTAAHNRGVRVRYIAAAATNNSALDAPPPFPVLYGNDLALMHHKFLIADAGLPNQAWVMSGSLNWTTANMTYDYNNTLFIQDQSLARAYELEFEEMWGSSGTLPDPLNSRFGAAKTDNTPHYFLIGGKPVESWFSPSDQVTQRIVERIESADHQASFCIFSFTKNEIGNAYIKAHDGGVWVRGIMENINDPGAELDWLVENGVPVVPHPAGSLMHHKYAVVDAGYPAADPLVLTGSHNWTNAAENSNDENTLVIHDPDLALLYQAEFERRWTETTTATADVSKPVIRIYPNPAVDALFIQFAPEENRDITAIISDGQGRVCFSGQLNFPGVARLPLGSLPAGSYFLPLTSDRGHTTIPFQTLPH